MTLNPAHFEHVIHTLFSAPDATTPSALRLPPRERLQLIARRLNHEAWIAAQHGHEERSERLYDQARRIAPNHAVLP